MSLEVGLGDPLAAYEVFKMPQQVSFLSRVFEDYFYRGPKLSKAPDLRPRRIKKPGKLLIFAALICTPGCFVIPFVGWLICIVGWVGAIRQYRAGMKDDQFPFGTFYREGPPPVIVSGTFIS